jgi:hypothetical protein
VAQAQEHSGLLMNDEVYSIIFDNPTEYQIFKNKEKDSTAILKLLVASGTQYNEKEIAEIVYQLDSITSALAAKRGEFKNPKKWLRWVFSYSQENYLRHYEAYQPLSLLLTKGIFNCVSGTAFYAIVMKKAGVSYQIKETLYHAYLTVQLDKKSYIIESTLPIYGLKRNIKHLERHLYVSNEQDFIQPITLQQLCALQYYNDAVTNFNAKDYNKAFTCLVRAGMLYDSERVTNLLQLTLSCSPKDLNKYIPASLAQKLRQ